MREVVFGGEVKTIDGVKRFVPSYQKLWQNTLNKCKEGQLCKIHFKEVKKIRSLPQNRLYWLYLSVIADETGNSEESLHFFFKRKFLPYVIRELFGEKLIQLTSTTGLSSNEFTEYMMKIEDLTEIPIPDVAGFIKERDNAPLL